MNIAKQMNAALDFYRAGQYGEAANSFKRVLARDPNNAEAYYRLGLIAHRRGQFGEAQAALRSALAVAPRQPVFHYTLGLVLHDLGNIDAAVESFRAAVALKPDFAQAWNNLGIVLQDQGLLAEAESAFRAAIGITPDYVGALNNLGTVLRGLSRVDEARECLERAVRLRPDFQSAHYNLGNTLLALGQHAQAAASLGEAVRLQPSHAEAHYSLAQCLDATNDLQGAIAAFERAIALKPGYRAPILGLANMLARNNLTAEARARYLAAVAPDDLLAKLAAHLVVPIVYGSGSEIDAAREGYEQGLDALCRDMSVYDGLAPEAVVNGVQWTNFYLAYQGRNDRRLQEKYGDFVTRLLRRAVPEFMTPIAARDPRGRRIRVGYVSKFFKHCTAGNYFKSWITDLAKSEFEIFVYYLDYPEDKVTREVMDKSDVFVKATEDSSIVAKRIKEDALDILVYPEIGMDPKTFGLAALRLAPVQCAGWGHPVTTGLPNMDYFISAAAMEPEHADEMYSERLVLLEGIGTGYPRPELPAPKQRADFGLPENRTLYLYPQSLFKIHPDNDESIAEVLHRDGNGVLVLFENQSAQVTGILRNRLDAALRRRGMEANDRVIVLPYMRHEDYLNVNMLCDLMLDSMYWSGGNTSLDALACGLPVVTLPGAYMRGRQTAGMLALAGVPELVAASPDDYAAIACRLGTDPDWRASIRARLAVGTQALFDQTAPVRSLEAFYRRAVRPSN